MEQVLPEHQPFNATRLRNRTWEKLNLAAGRVGRAATRKAAIQEARALMKDLLVIEQYWAYPGSRTVEQLQEMLQREEYTAFAHRVTVLVRDLASGADRSDPEPEQHGQREKGGKEELPPRQLQRNFFEVLFVDDATPAEVQTMREKLERLREPNDQFVYDVVHVHTFQDALIALRFNANIQACVVRYGVPFRSEYMEGILKDHVSSLSDVDHSDRSLSEMGPLLGKAIKEYRPEVDTYYVTETPVSDLKDSTLQNFRRIFYRKEDLQELHLTLVRGIKERFNTPFFSALKKYSQKPMGVFHAMPISRGNSVFKSRWIQDLGDFYGRNLFLAETSATTGGLDSLLQPTGPLKKAQEFASRAFGSRQTYFATNGTSTSNKVVLQALVEPGDLVLIDRDCHKSHHYGLVLSGALPVYLDSYALPEFSMYGAVPLEHIIEKMELLRKADRLDKVKMLLLTNCTFDGLVYNVERVMEAVLAIKPDMIFLWDEAWFAFAGFSHTFKQRTAMYVARKLHRKYHSEEYRETYKAHLAGLGKGEAPRLPDPEKVRIRVYATQSTHKTLSSFRQGSMIHIWDEDFRRKSEESFHEAYMTHISTSPNYQILASLDAGRRQVEFEGYELVEKSIETAMLLRAKVQDHPKLRKYFDIITVSDLIPEQYRGSGITEYYSKERGWNRLERSWKEDEFVLDPTKINLYVGKTGVDGDTFKNKYLMDKFGIQINKTSRNSVLFMTNIGTTRSSVAYLIHVLLQIADELEENIKAMNHEEKKIQLARIRTLTQDPPPLPDFSRFHNSFQAVPGVPGGDLRQAYFLAYKEDRCEYVKLEDSHSVISGGRELVSASFVIPYPPGFPVLVPGQVVSPEILDFLIALDVKEIHGYTPELGLRVFTEAALGRQMTGTAMGGMRTPMAKGNGSTARTALRKKG